MHNLSSKEAQIRIEKLSREIDRLRYQYHVLDNPEITDEVYSSLMGELRELEEKFPQFKSVYSPTQRVGGKPLDKFIKVKHAIRQWSFDDIFDFAELKKWEEKIVKIQAKSTASKEELDYCAELKIDGLKIILTYKKGIFAQGATRGDGVIGEDITENLKTIQSIPLKLNQSISCIVVGECFLSKKELERINKDRKKKGEPPFANSRNAAAGSIRQLDPKIVAGRKLDSFIYDLEYLEDKNKIPSKQTEELEFLKKLGFKTNPDYKYCRNIAEVEDYYQKWTQKKEQENYGIDGVVIKINFRKIQEALGYTGKAPRFGVAYKFPAEKATTIVEDIQLQVGRTGAITPVAKLRSVRIAGSLVGKATLHNVDEINRLGLKIGDTVVIHKAGDVIPEVVEVIKNLRTGKEKKFRMPSLCPICGGRLTREIINHKTRKESANHYCLNKNCLAIKEEEIIHFVSKKGFNIEGLGEKIVEQLIRENLIKQIADIFALKKSDLVPLERFAEKSAQNIIEAIEKNKRISLEKFLYALGIRHLGEESAVLIAQNINNVETVICNKENQKSHAYQQAGEIKNQNSNEKFKINNISDIIKYFPNIGKESWMNIKGIGDKSAESLRKWFSNHKNLAMLQKMKNLGVEVYLDQKPQIANQKLQGKAFILTGELKSFTRDEAKDMIRQEGGNISSAVSAKTDYVLAGNNPGSKYQKAKELGVKIIGEKELREMTA